MIVLASTSRYRKALLERLGIPFEVDFPDCDERKLEAVGGHSGEIALRLAHAKAASVRARRRTDLVIGSDQFVVCDGQILHKPITAERACEHFRNIVGDIVDGKLNAKEIGTKFGEVARDAKNADEKELHAASARAEDIAKTFDPETMFPAVVEVHDACSLVGR